MNHLPQQHGRWICGVTGVVLTFLLGGCSSFESSWQQALERSATPQPTADVIAPAWIGSWHSEPSGHEGPLRCVVSAVTDKDGQAIRDDAGARYAFHFHALWGLNFPAEYTIEMSVRKEDGRVTFTGEQDLGPLAGGVYRCEGHIKGGQFRATYTSKHDHGTFEMKIAPPE